MRFCRFSLSASLKEREEKEETRVLVQANKLEAKNAIGIRRKKRAQLLPTAD
jgi:hypothetical protein